MPKKQTKKPKYPKELFVASVNNMWADRFLGYAYAKPDDMGQGEVAIYKFDRMAKVTRTVKVE